MFSTCFVEHISNIIQNKKKRVKVLYLITVQNLKTDVLGAAANPGATTTYDYGYGRQYDVTKTYYQQAGATPGYTAPAYTATTTATKVLLVFLLLWLCLTPLNVHLFSLNCKVDVLLISFWKSFFLSES